MKPTEKTVKRRDQWRSIKSKSFSEWEAHEDGGPYMLKTNITLTSLVSCIEGIGFMARDDPWGSMYCTMPTKSNRTRILAELSDVKNRLRAVDVGGVYDPATNSLKVEYLRTEHNEWMRQAYVIVEGEVRTREPDEPFKEEPGKPIVRL